MCLLFYKTNSYMLRINKKTNLFSAMVAIAEESDGKTIPGQEPHEELFVTSESEGSQK